MYQSPLKFGLRHSSYGTVSFSAGTHSHQRDTENTENQQAEDAILRADSPLTDQRPSTLAVPYHTSGNNDNDWDIQVRKPRGYSDSDSRDIISTKLPEAHHDILHGWDNLPCLAGALYDFQPEMPDELPMEMGELLGCFWFNPSYLPRIFVNLLRGMAGDDEEHRGLDAANDDNCAEINQNSYVHYDVSDGWIIGFKLDPQKHVEIYNEISLERPDFEKLSGLWRSCLVEWVEMSTADSGEMNDGSAWFGFIPSSYIEFYASPYFEHHKLQSRIQKSLPAFAQSADSTSLSDTHEFKSQNFPTVQPTEQSTAFLPNRLLQRFSPFVTSGAEDFILTGGEKVPESVNKHYSVWNSIYKNTWLGRTLTDSGNVARISEVPLGAEMHEQPGNLANNQQATLNNHEPDDKPTQAPSDDEVVQESPFFITDGPNWLDESTSFPLVEISGFQLRKSGFRAYTVYRIDFRQMDIPAPNKHTNFQTPLYSSMFYLDTSGQNLANASNLSVYRRYSHFVFLREHLVNKYPMLHVPQLPPKRYNLSINYYYPGRVTESSYGSSVGAEPQEFILKRKRALCRWLSRILGHFVLRNDELTEAFLYAGAQQFPQSATSKQLYPVANHFRQLTPESLYSESSTHSGHLNVDENSDFDHEESFLEAYRKIVKNTAYRQPVNFWKRIFHPEFNLIPDAPTLSGISGTLNSIYRSIYFKTIGSRSKKGTKQKVRNSRISPDDITGDYLSLSNQLKFVKSYENRIYGFSSGLKRRADKMSEYSPSFEVLSDALRQLIVTPMGSGSNQSLEFRDLCHNENCQQCVHISNCIQNIQENVRMVSQIVNETGVQTYSELAEWLEEWSAGCHGHKSLSDNLPTENYSSIAKLVKGVHLEGVRLGKDIVKAVSRTGELDLPAMIPEEDSSDDEDSINLGNFKEISANASVIRNSSRYSKLPEYLQPPHMLSRLTTVYNLIHAETNHWFHKQRQLEIMGILEKLINCEVQRCQKELEKWMECQQSINLVKSKLCGTTSNLPSKV